MVGEERMGGCESTLIQAKGRVEGGCGMGGLVDWGGCPLNPTPPRGGGGGGGGWGGLVEG